MQSTMMASNLQDYSSLHSQLQGEEKDLVWLPLNLPFPPITQPLQWSRRAYANLKSPLNNVALPSVVSWDELIWFISQRKRELGIGA